MGSSHPDDVDQLPVPADPGAPDETPDPADWDDAWLPEWLGDEPGGTPPVEDAGPGPAAGDPEPELDGGQPDTDPVPDAGVPDAGVPDAGEPHAGEPDPDPTPDAGREPDQKGQPDVEDAPDAPDAPDQRAPEPDLAPAAVPAGDLPNADPEEGPVAATTADAGPAGPTAEPAEPAEAAEAAEPKAPAAHSGRLMLRMPQSLHTELAQAAEREEVSLNQFITNTLAASMRWHVENETAPTPPRWLPAALVTNIVVVVIAGVIALVLLIVAWQQGW
jgi:hypothetical protein